MIVDEGESVVLLNPNIYSMKLHDEESSFKWGEWCWSDDQEHRLILLAFGSCGYLEYRTSSDFFLMILWEGKTKVLLGPGILFELGD